MLFPIILAAALAGQVSTDNFKMDRCETAVEKKVIHYAEVYRRDIAVEWFGEEVQPWGWRHDISVDQEGPRGGYNQFSLLGTSIHASGDETHILYSSLPHEICHSVNLFKLGLGLPRWVDEGMAMLSERQEMGCRSNLPLLKSSTRVPLATFLDQKSYPLFFRQNFYGQCLSLTKFLVDKKGKREFTAFVRRGRTHGWADAAARHYGYGDVATLESEWQSWHRKSYGPFLDDR